jgi:hypothetical protein
MGTDWHVVIRYREDHERLIEGFANKARWSTGLPRTPRRWTSSHVVGWAKRSVDANSIDDVSEKRVGTARDVP